MEELEVHPDNFDSICRICFSKDNLSSVFEIFCDEKCLTEILLECSSINVSKNDTLPKNICMNCVQSLCLTYNFLNLSRKSNDILQCVIGDLKSIENDDINSIESEEKIIIQIEESNDGIDTLLQMNSDRAEYHENLRSHHVDSNKYGLFDSNDYFCEVCNERFHTLFELIHHFEAIRHNKAEYECPACGKNFISQKRFRKHLYYHSGWSKCNLCFRKFNFLSNLRKHLSTVHGRENFICHSCGKEFRSSWFFHEHVASHTRETWCVCHKCGKQFSQYSKYFLHLKSHDLKQNYQPQRRYDCVFCNKVFGSFKMLKIHLTKCPMNNREETTLTVKNEQFITNETKWCNICQKYFKTKYTFENHLKVHSDVKPYICDCGKSFRLQYNLRVHQRIHTGEKPYVCGACGRCFAQKQQLNTHIRTHTLEKPYQCHYCDKCFATRGNATVHMRLHTGETPFVCEVCSRGYVDSSGLKRHKCTVALNQLLIYEFKNEVC